MVDPLAAGSSRPSVVTIGNFDGVHVGHRRLIGEAMRVAQRNGWRSVALTFDRHPATVVRPGSVPPLLTDLEQKVALLRATGVDEVVVLTFDEARAAEPAEEFAREMLAGRLGARAVVVGTNFRFGNRHLGDVALLAKLGDELGFAVTAFDLVADDERREPVSSSRIRALIETGELEHASRLLARPYRLPATLEGGSPHGAAPAADELVGARREAPDRGRAIVAAGLCLPPPGRYEGAIVASSPRTAIAPGTGSLARLELRGRRVEGEVPPGLAPGDPVLIELTGRSA
jgi:riboflavin kinase/FMN adenylyltransferase